jgi:hypothetical protein
MGDIVDDDEKCARELGLFACRTIWFMPSFMEIPIASYQYQWSPSVYWTQISAV